MIGTYRDTALDPPPSGPAPHQHPRYGHHRYAHEDRRPAKQRCRQVRAVQLDQRALDRRAGEPKEGGAEERHAEAQPAVISVIDSARRKNGLAAHPMFCGFELRLATAAGRTLTYPPGIVNAHVH